MVVVDFETASYADLPVVGAQRYAADPTTDVRCLGFRIDDEPAQIWVPGSPIPEPLLQALGGPQPLWAHNAAFDRAIWSSVLVPRYGFPHPRGGWRDSMLLAALAGLPRSLAGAADALNLEQRKDADGKRLVKLFCLPQRDGSLARPEDHPEDWARFLAYCRQDVRTTAALIERLSWLHPQLEREQPVADADHALNLRGVRVDLPLVQAMIDAAEQLQASLAHECRQITGGVGPTQVSALLAWLNAQGADLLTLDEITVAEALGESLPNHVRRVLELRLEGSRSAWRKGFRILEMADAEGRLHDQLQIGGTHTLRWAGRGVQLQNLPRPRLSKTALGTALSALEHDPESLPIVFSRPLEALSSLMRSTLIASEGQRLGIADFSKIEVVVLAWLAQDVAMLRALREGQDLYRQLASRIYRTPPEAVTKEQRHTGKAGILGGGYGAGWQAFQNACRKQGVKIAEPLARATVEAYREHHAAVPIFWRSLETAAVYATITGVAHAVGPHLRFRRHEDWLLCDLPSGRAMAWYRPHIEARERFNGVRHELCYFGPGMNGRLVEQHTFGGKLAENVVSSTARDLLATSLVRAERTGLRPVLTVHDEIVCEGPPGIGQAIADAMLHVPDWAEGLPIGVEHQEGARYGK